VSAGINFEWEIIPIVVDPRVTSVKDDPCRSGAVAGQRSIKLVRQNLIRRVLLGAFVPVYGGGGGVDPTEVVGHVVAVSKVFEVILVGR
jgi:hypothetical protein